MDRLRDASSRIGYYDGRGHWQPGGAGLVTEAADAIEQAEARLRKAELLAEAVDAFAVPTAGFLMDRLSHKYIAPTILSAWITALETSRDALAAFRNTEDAK